MPNTTFFLIVIKFSISSHLTLIHLNPPPTFLCFRNFPSSESSWEAELSPIVLANIVSSYVPKPTLQVGCQHLTKSDAPSPASNVQEGGEVHFCGGIWNNEIRPQKTAAAAYRGLCQQGPLRNPSVAPNPPAGADRSSEPEPDPLTSGSSLTNHYLFNKSPSCSRQLELRLWLIHAGFIVA